MNLVEINSINELKGLTKDSLIEAARQMIIDDMKDIHKYFQSKDVLCVVVISPKYMYDNSKTNSILVCTIGITIETNKNSKLNFNNEYYDEYYDFELSYTITTKKNGSNEIGCISLELCCSDDMMESIVNTIPDIDFKSGEQIYLQDIRSRSIEILEYVNDNYIVIVNEIKNKYSLFNILDSNEEIRIGGNILYHNINDI